MTTAGTSNPKYLRMADTWARRIRHGELVAGDFLPSQTALMERESVSLSTVRQAVAELSRRGLVQPEHGRGVRVLAQSAAVASPAVAEVAIGRVGLVIVDPHPYDRIYLDVANGVSQSLIESGQGMLVRHAASESEASAEIDRLCEVCDAIILVGTVTDAHIARVQAAGLPAALAGHAVSAAAESRLSCVKWDVASMGVLAVQALAMQGHRRLAFLVAGLPTSFQRDLHASVVAEAAVVGGSCELVSTRYDSQAGEDILDQFLAGSEATAAIVVGVPLTLELERAAHRAGRSVPADLSVLSIGPPGELATAAGVAYSRLMLSHDELGRITAETLLEHPQAICSRALPPRMGLGGSIMSHPSI